MVAMGGALGSLMRWGLVNALQRVGGSLPFGTLVANVCGSFLIGLVASESFRRGLISPQNEVFLIIGVFGGFTTFSAFSYETFTLIRDGQWPVALMYAVASVVIGTLAAAGGFLLGARL